MDIDILEAEEVAIDIATEGNKVLLADDDCLVASLDDWYGSAGSDDDDACVGQDRWRCCTDRGENVTPSLEITSLCFSRSCLTRFPFWVKVLLQIRQTFSGSDW